jgi:hypothetical protein
VKAFAGGVLTQSHLRNRNEGTTAPLIFGAVAKGHIEIVQLLISAGVDVNAVAS